VFGRFDLGAFIGAATPSKVVCLLFACITDLLAALACVLRLKIYSLNLDFLRVWGLGFRVNLASTLHAHSRVQLVRFEDVERSEGSFDSI
jgi:hypothetical protein